MKALITVIAMSLLASTAFAETNPLGCDKSQYWIKGNYKLDISNDDVSKEDLLLALKTIHYTGSPQHSYIVITRSHAYNHGHVIGFSIKGVDANDESGAEFHNALLSKIMRTLSGRPGLSLSCAMIQPGGAVVHN